MDLLSILPLLELFPPRLERSSLIRREDKNQETEDWVESRGELLVKWELGLKRINLYLASDKLFLQQPKYKAKAAIYDTSWKLDAALLRRWHTKMSLSATYGVVTLVHKAMLQGFFSPYFSYLKVR